MKRISGLHWFELQGLAASRAIRKMKYLDQENAGMKVVTLIAAPTLTKSGVCTQNPSGEVNECNGDFATSPLGIVATP
jgi:hypothetical protein